MTTAAPSTAYVILAAGRGSRMGRVGDNLHKALLPLQQKAILTHLIELGPPDSELIICTGYRADQLHDYMKLAHPSQPVTWVDVPDWDQPGAGPGASLLAARRAIGSRNLVVTSCDTLWQPDQELWHRPHESWAAYAPVPPGSPPERWCRLDLHGDRVTAVIDKQPYDSSTTQAYVGLASIATADLQEYWRGIATGALLNGECRDPAGIAALAAVGKLRGRRIGWLDTGDLMAYRRAIILRDGYDWSKEKEATWVLPGEGRVVKWWADDSAVDRIAWRREWLSSLRTGGIPRALGQSGGMIALEYITGQIGYDALKTSADLIALLKSRAFNYVCMPVDVADSEMQAACSLFYKTKTLARVEMLRQPVRRMAEGILQKVSWQQVIENGTPARWHGDFNLGNMIFDGVNWHFIDWRDSFAVKSEQFLWGDYRHDVAKFLGGLRIRWDWARHGDFTPWALGRELESVVYNTIVIPEGTELIGVLCLLASAPLHEAPLDEVIVTRAAEWLSELKT